MTKENKEGTIEDEERKQGTEGRKVWKKDRLEQIQ